MKKETRTKKSTHNISTENSMDSHLVLISRQMRLYLCFGTDDVLD